jgi:hypothetical protein
MPQITYEKITVVPDEEQLSWLRGDISPIDIHATTIHADADQSETDSDERSHTLIQMGMGNEGARVRETTATRLVALGIQDLTIIDALPFWEAKPDQESLINFASYVMDFVAAYLKEKHQIDTLHAIGESQGSVPVLESMRKPGTPLNGRLGLIHPLGLTPDILTIPRFARRMLQTAAQNDIELAGTLVGAHAAQRAMADLLFTRGQQIKSAVNYDGITPLGEILQSHEAGVFIGEDDRLFPPKEVKRGLGKAGIQGCKFDVSEGPHAAPATRIGAKLAGRACYWVQNGILLPQERATEAQPWLRPIENT